jgi:hypothetical protein
MSKQILEHPNDWQMGEGPFADACSRLGYRLISLADKDPQREPVEIEVNILLSIAHEVRALGG